MLLGPTVGGIVALLGWAALAFPAASVSTHPFGRYEMVLQEGTPVAQGEFLGVVRRQTGLPEYPLMLSAHKQVLELHLLGPGNRPYRLSSTQFLGPSASRSASTRFVVERATREGEKLTIQMRHARLPRSIRLTVDLRELERLVEGAR
jgi:hypothetical protein